jgi:hypothetical protein
MDSIAHQMVRLAIASITPNTSTITERLTYYDNCGLTAYQQNPLSEHEGVPPQLSDRASPRGNSLASTKLQVPREFGRIPQYRTHLRFAEYAS